jgi:hypothetical protein
MHNSRYFYLLKVKIGPTQNGTSPKGASTHDRDERSHREFDLPSTRHSEEKVRRSARVSSGHDSEESGKRRRCVDQRLRKVLYQKQECAKGEESRDRGRFDARVKKGRDFQVFPNFASESQLKRGMKAQITLSRFLSSQGLRDNALLASLDRSMRGAARLNFVLAGERLNTRRS